MRLGLVLLFDETTVAACVRYGETLSQGRRLLACVGEAALPHLTLLHVEGVEDTEALWQEASLALVAEYSLEFLSLGYLPYDDPPGRMVWVMVPATPSLRDAEQKALALGTLAGARVTTRNRERFQPHLTLAIWQGGEPPAVWALPPLIGRTDVRGRLALVEIGPHGTCVRVLRRA